MLASRAACGLRCLIGQEPCRYSGAGTRALRVERPLEALDRVVHQVQRAPRLLTQLGVTVFYAVCMGWLMRRTDRGTSIRLRTAQSNPPLVSDSSTGTPARRRSPDNDRPTQNRALPRLQMI
jgi:hypothetical protein